MQKLGILKKKNGNGIDYLKENKKEWASQGGPFKEVILTCFSQEASPWNDWRKSAQNGKQGSPEVHRKESVMVNEKKDGQYVWDEGRETEIGGNKFREVGRGKII